MARDSPFGGEHCREHTALKLLWGRVGEHTALVPSVRGNTYHGGTQNAVTADSDEMFDENWAIKFHFWVFSLLNSTSSMLEPLPWSTFQNNTVHFWIHYGLCILGFILALITMFVQFSKPAPYGKHAKDNTDWGPMVHQRIAHTLSDAPSGVIVFSLVFFLYGVQRGYVNITFYILWMCHYVHRGIIHPWVMKYSSAKTPIGIPIAGLFPNLLYSYLNADWIGSASYVHDYFEDPRLIIGLVLFLVGFCINRAADLTLRNLRSGENRGYSIPKGCLFQLVSCPNYLGEMLQWFGWAVGTWSVAGLVWFMFGSGTFVPRAKQNHEWYKERFPDYPKNRKSLIPFIY